MLRENQWARHFCETAGWQADGATKDEERRTGYSTRFAIAARSTLTWHSPAT